MNVWWLKRTAVYITAVKHIDLPIIIEQPKKSHAHTHTLQQNGDKRTSYSVAANCYLYDEFYPFSRLMDFDES